MRKISLLLILVFLSLIIISCAEPQPRGDGEEPEITSQQTQTAMPTTQTTEPASTLSATRTAASLPTATTAVQQLTVNVNAANVRSGPSTGDEVVGTIRSGEYVNVLGISPDAGWYEVELPDGTVGWIGGSIAVVSDDLSADLTQAGGETKAEATAAVKPQAPEPTAVPVPPPAAQEPSSEPPPVVEQPTEPAPAGPPAGVPGSCDCSGDNLNCGDFGTHSQAQACFNYCVDQGRGDIYGLDKDGDKNVCESLPG